MIYTDMTMLAMIIAYDAHRGQVDKSGVPYILHPAHVAEQMTDEISCTVALLHDVLEDSDFQEKDLRKIFPAKVLKPVILLTKNKSEDYIEYIERLKHDEVARKVKIEDLKHNLDPSRRVKNPTKQDEQRYEKYQKALKILEEME